MTGTLISFASVGRWVGRCLALLAAWGGPAFAADSLQNDLVRAEFDGRGLTAIHDLAAKKAIVFERDSVAVFAGDASIESDFLAAAVEKGEQTRTYRFESAPWTVTVVYELKPGWRFISKQVYVSGSGKKDFRVRRIEMLRGQVATPIAECQRIRDGALLRFAGAGGTPPGHGLFLILQNPFLQWKRQDQCLSIAYVPDMTWKPGGEPFASDRLCLGVTTLAGVSFPVARVPEWKLVPDHSPTQGPRIYRSEVNAIVECVRSFLLWRPTKSERINVGWCENDYQIDIAAAEGRTEYKRIIDQAAAVGCRHILFGPANGADAPLKDSRDAWGWENTLWFTMGQKIRKGEWDPAKDKLPASVQELVDYAKAKDVRFVAYVYPSLPFMQQKEWTSWVPNGQPGGYLGADTGMKSFQDWLLGKLVDFHKSTGAGGYAFDHWWIAYEETVSSKYAQWAGCRRILEELRRRFPDTLIDGRQQYHHFGVWTWLAGTYPHPLNSDEQPESFRAFPDLHFDRVSADRQRRTAWFYRMECFVPPEIMPGYMTHQTPRNDANGRTVRTRFRARDWDYLGWRYSVISSIATAPFNHVVNVIPARDEAEFKAFPEADKKWFRDWLDWTDRNFDLLRNVTPILGAPQLGRVDGMAAFKDGRGVVFLFNPNYRVLTAELALDETIGLAGGKRFVLRQLYPDAERGMLLAPPSADAWNYGDKVTLAMPGADAMVIEVEPAPESVDQPVLLGATGHASADAGQLMLQDVAGEAGTKREVKVLLTTDRKIDTVRVNGADTKFTQAGKCVSLQVRFAGAPFASRQQIGRYDPQFAASTYRAEIAIPLRVFRQLQERRRLWPIPWTEEELHTTWLAPHRLLLFINVADPNDEMKVSLKIDGQPVEAKAAYSSIVRSNPRNTFVGWYADVSSLKPDVPHMFEVELPGLTPGQFQGLFLDNVEAERTREMAAEERTQ